MLVKVATDNIVGTDGSSQSSKEAYMVKCSQHDFSVSGLGVQDLITTPYSAYMN